MSTVITPYQQLNEKLLQRLFIIRRLCLIGVYLIAGTVLCGWLVPTLGHMFPSGWVLMKANTAASLMVFTGGLVLIHKPGIRHGLFWVRLCAVIVIFLSATAILGYFTGRTYWVETLLAADSNSVSPGRMSIQTAAYLVLAGLTLIFSGLSNKHWLPFVDVLVTLLLIIVLIIIAGYSFDASYLLGHSPYTRTSPHTLACMVFLGFALVVYRSRSGLFMVFVGQGIGSQMVRLIVPFALVLPFLIVSAGVYAMYAGWLSGVYIAAITASLSSALLFIIIMLLGRKINDLERLRDAVDNINKSGANPYQITYTEGDSGIESTTDEIFAGLVDQADAAMYRRKRHKQHGKQELDRTEDSRSVAK